jgi:hypothetical protein
MKLGVLIGIASIDFSLCCAYTLFAATVVTSASIESANRVESHIDVFHPLNLRESVPHKEIVGYL